jgi:hypothetical protein
VPCFFIAPFSISRQTAGLASTPVKWTCGIVWAAQSPLNRAFPDAIIQRWSEAATAYSKHRLPCPECCVSVLFDAYSG